MLSAPRGCYLQRGEAQCKVACSGEYFAHVGIKLPSGAVQNHLFCATVVMFLNLSMDGTSRCGDKGVMN